MSSSLAMRAMLSVKVTSFPLTEILVMCPERSVLVAVSRSEKARGRISGGTEFPSNILSHVIVSVDSSAFPVAETIFGRMASTLCVACGASATRPGALRLSAAYRSVPWLLSISPAGTFKPSASRSPSATV